MDREAVLRAVAEYEAFLSTYGFRPARRYFLEVDGTRYDSKAIVAAAHAYQFPDEGPLRADEFIGGLTTVVPKLRSLGFTIVEANTREGTPGGSTGRLAARRNWRPARGRYGAQCEPSRVWWRLG